MSSLSNPSPASRLPIPPCECGHPNPSWHGQREDRRDYLCANCFVIKKALEMLSEDYVQRNKHRLGVLGQQSLDSAVRWLKEGDL